MSRFNLIVAIALSSGCDAISGKLPAPAGLNGDCSPGFVQALDRNDSAAVRDLAARGAIVSCLESSDHLQNAIRQHQISRLSLLLDAGVDPNYGTPGSYGSHSMRHVFMSRASNRRDLEAAKLLLEHGANPDQRDTYATSDGHLGDATPLMAASALGDIEFAALLMRFEPDLILGARDAAGVTALGYARRRSDAGMVTLLSRAGTALPDRVCPDDFGLSHPATLDEAAQLVLQCLGKDRRAMMEAYNEARFSHPLLGVLGFGAWFRSTDSPLRNHLLSLGFESPDDMYRAVLSAAWHRGHNRVFDLTSRVDCARAWQREHRRLVEATPKGEGRTVPRVPFDCSDTQRIEAGRHLWP